MNLFPMQIILVIMEIRSAGFQAKKDINKNISSQIAINILSNNKIAIDESFLEVKNGNALFGFGKINRNWSFSPNTSLILSKNARPAESIYFALGKKNKPSDQLILRKIPWSFENFQLISFNITENKKSNDVRHESSYRTRTQFKI